MHVGRCPDTRGETCGCCCCRSGHATRCSVSLLSARWSWPVSHGACRISCPSWRSRSLSPAVLRFWDCATSSSPGTPSCATIPIAAHLRFLLEKIRPEMRQYFFEDDKDGMPFPRDKRAIVYQRAKGVLDKRPFGTQYDVYQPHYEWLHHSMAPKAPSREPFRIFDRRPRLHAALLGVRLQHLGHELRLAVGQRHPRAQQGRQARRLRARYGRRRLQPLSPRARRRHHLGDRLGLFRLPQRRRHVRAREIRRGRRQPADQDGRAQIEPGRQARPRRRAAGRQGDARDRRASAACRAARTASRRPGIRRSRRPSR